MSSTHTEGAPEEEPAGATTPQQPERPPRRRQKTPMFHAVHHARYERQALINRIQEERSTTLICFLTGERSMITREDTLGFGDLLDGLPRDEPIDLLLHTYGGDIDAAEKLITMVDNVAGSAPLRVIVPDCAKSAGTLMALGANKIAMSDSSELGPIDPQVPWRDAAGNVFEHSVNTYLDAYKKYKEALAENPEDQVARMMLDKLEPATIELFKNLHMRARKLAEKLLAERMLKGGAWSAVAPQLMDTKRWYTHGQVIHAKAAKEIGLEVEFIASDSEQWRRIWQLYCLQRMAVGPHARLFESDWVSLPISDESTSRR